MRLTDLLRNPDRIHIQGEDGTWRDQREGERLTCQPTPAGLRLTLRSSGGASLRAVRLRWRWSAPAGLRILGDAWERAYGDLTWRGIEPERVLPWYALIHSPTGTSGIGVRTGAGAFCGWQIDHVGITLDCDCRSGGIGVRLGDRELDLATVVALDGSPEQESFDLARIFCRALCAAPRLPNQPVYGANNWYYAYGQTHHQACLDDAGRVAAWSDSTNRPFMVLDDGWQAARTWEYNGGPWDHGNRGFPDMAGLAAGIAARGARPGLWYRPLVTAGMQPRSWTLEADRSQGWQTGGRVLDPTIPEVREHLYADLSRLIGWGFQLIKHDFSTYDLLGWWGSGSTGPWIADGWRFHGNTRTSAEIISDFYKLLRAAAGDCVLLGCNTIGHLAAGTHEIHRTGDDTSGRSWERTRRMGINALAFRMPQHNAFFAVDADCVGITDAVAWDCNRQWLDLLARSGTPLFISADPAAVGPGQERALRAACRMAAAPRPVSEPLDWLDTTCPTRWRHADGETTYDWYGDDGCHPAEKHGRLS
jgi:alpha-galactosidase